MARKNKNKKVVVARFSALGDVAMCIPVLYSACRTYPDVQFTFVTRQAFTPIFLNKPENLTVFGADLAGRHKGVSGIRRLCSELGRPNVYIDLHSVLRSRLLGLFMRLKGVKVSTFDKGRKYKRKLLKYGGGVMSPLKHTMYRYQDAFAAVSMPFRPNFEGLFAEAAPDVQTFAAVTAPKPATEKWVGIAPFAAHPGKIYPEERMLYVLDNLAARENTRIFLFGGGAEETEKLTAWAAKYSNVTCVAGKNLGFVGELSLMHYMDVMLTMDSGNMHLSAISGARTVSIWGATHTSAGFSAWRSQASDCLCSALECRPCSIFGNKPCKFGDMRCMYSLKRQTIISHINDILL